VFVTCSGAPGGEYRVYREDDSYRPIYSQCQLDRDQKVFIVKLDAGEVVRYKGCETTVCCVRLGDELW